MISLCSGKLSQVFMELIDTHAHLTSSDILPNLDAILARAQTAHLQYIINVCLDLASLQAGLDLEKRCAWIRTAGGTHPHDAAKDGDANFDGFAAAARSGRLVAIGETGLDYHYEYSPRPAQQKLF